MFPDTSPRGANIAGEDDSYDFGSAAGFYLNAYAVFHYTSRVGGLIEALLTPNQDQREVEQALQHVSPLGWSSLRSLTPLMI